ncbi:hypothetical protein [Coleofasciculus chthonoplastes]|uniref:hypothetical protein n=1 Tax=Coleofasciculus chthonoplastes TaxID=64178 RepID=UPI0005C6DED2|nr:hypothetical protein [Coleofasciculus chthonoplastes]
MNYSDMPGIIIIALDIATKELCKCTEEPHTQIKQRLMLSAIQQFEEMTEAEITKWVKTNYPMPGVKK